MNRVFFAGVSLLALLAACRSSSAPASVAASSSSAASPAADSPATMEAPGAMTNATSADGANNAGAVAAKPASPRSAAKGGAYPKPSQEELKARLSPLSYQVTQNDATEPPFHNAYWDNHEPGLYVDVVTGEPLFSSQDKFESGTGWPSFSRPIDPGHVVSKSDTTIGMVRTEVRSASGGSHLGHVFDDGPEPTGLRYCINSASLRFIPVARLEAEGYGSYRARFSGGGSVAASTPPTDTNNACAQPAPGERAGCSTTLATVILGADASVAAALAKVDGVLETERGTVGPDSAARVVFDPKTVPLSQLLDAWARASANDGASRHVLVLLTAEQKADADAWKLHASVPRGLTVSRDDEKAFTRSSR